MSDSPCPRIPGVLCASGGEDVCCLDAPRDTERFYVETYGESEPIHDAEMPTCVTAPTIDTSHEFPDVLVHEPLDENVFICPSCPTSGLPCGEAARLSPICCADVPPATEAATTFDGTTHHDVKPRYTDSATTRSPVTLDLTVLSIEDLFTELTARLFDEGEPLGNVIEGARRAYDGDAR